MNINSFIHTADWHFWDKHKYSIDNSRAEQLIFNANEIVNCAIENSIDMIIIAGDIYHIYNPDEKVSRMFTSVISRALKKNIMVRIITGNHDTNGIDYALDSLWNILGIGYYQENDLLRIYSHKVEWEDFDNVRFVYSPWNKNEIEFLRAAKENRNFDLDYNVLVSHNCINESITSTGYHIKSPITDELLSGWSYVALGDIHKYQKIGNNRFKATNDVYYSGSIIKLNWGERGDQKMFNVIELGDKKEGEKLEVMPVPICDIEMIEYKISAVNIDPLLDGVDSIDAINERSVKDSFIKAYISGSNIESKGLELKKALLNGGAKEVYIKEVSASISCGNSYEELQLDLSIDDAMKKYVDGLDKSEDEKKNLIVNGMKIIEGIR